MKQLYFDTCCYSRWQDDLRQTQMKAEANAISEIIDWRHINGHIIVGSPLVTAELRKNPDIEKRNADLRFFRAAVGRHVRPNAKVIARAKELQAGGLKKMDSRHLAIAEIAGVDIFITVDKIFLKTVTNRNLSKLKVINPLTMIGG